MYERLHRANHYLCMLIRQRERTLRPFSLPATNGDRIREPFQDAQSERETLPSDDPTTMVPRSVLSGTLRGIDEVVTTENGFK